MNLWKPRKLNSASVSAQIRARAKEQQIREKAYEIWEKRGRQGTPDENWDAAIDALKTQRFIQPWVATWKWTGLKEKKLWDFIALLIVPIVLATVGLGLQEFAKERERAQQAADKDREQAIASDKAMQESLVKYLDQMAELLESGLLKAKSSSNTYIIAQVKTVTVLQSLDATRQHLVIQFLEAAGLNASNQGKGLLYQARMSKANLSGADLSGSNLKSVDFSSANLSRANLSQANLSQANLSDAEFKRTDLIVAGLGEALQRPPQPYSAKLGGADLSSSNLNSADLSAANLIRANLSSADLSDAKLHGAKLYDANLSRIKLNRADLTNANLTSTDLSYADLSFANLGSANLGGANLHNANLYFANLSNVKGLTEEQLKATLLCQTTMPNNTARNRDCKSSGSTIKP